MFLVATIYANSIQGIQAASALSHFAFVLFCTLSICTTANAAPGPNGIALGLYYKTAQEASKYEQMVDEIARTGASHISIVTLWGMEDIRSTSIQPHPFETPKDEVVRDVIRVARARGLSVMLFPILWLDKRAPGEWRGKLAPRNPSEWWKSYRRYILHFARLAAEEGVALYSIGSELSSMEKHVSEWRSLSRAVRRLYKGRLVYSANWDHFKNIEFWDAVDVVGLTGYYRLTDSMTPTVAELIAAWRPIKEDLLAWSKSLKRGFIFTEVGYPSLDGAAHSPWDYTTGKALDLDEQRVCFEAFRRTWVGESRLAGVFFWNWWGPPDGQNHWYTPRGKPAAGEIVKWMETRIPQMHPRE